MGRSLRHALVLAGLATLSCGESPDPNEVVVASIGGASVSVADLDAYFRSNLIDDEQDSRDRGQLDRVKSRLFDAFIDEQLLVDEAHRMGIEVSEEEVDADAPAASELQRSLGIESDRLLARRRLLLSKLEEAVARRVPAPTEDDVRAWLADHSGRHATDVRLTIRSRRFDTMREAWDAVRRIRGGVEKFEDAASAGEVAAAVELDEQAVSPEVRSAVGTLEPGAVSEPVSVYGGVFLFRLEGRTAGEVDEGTLVSVGREELLRERGRRANEELLRELRATSKVAIYDRRLPFAYLPPRDAS